MFDDDALYVHEFFMMLQYQDIYAQLVVKKRPIETGNTRSGFKVRGRHFQLTLNEIDNYEKLYNYLQSVLMVLKQMAFHFSCHL